MSTNAAETETAPTTVKADAPAVVPGREEVLKHFAREASGIPPEEPETPAAEPESETALSQPESETAPETPAEPAAEEAVENHLQDDAELSEALPPEVQEKINRRIGKEVAKTKSEREARESAEARLAEAEARLADRPETPAIKRDAALGHVLDDNALQAEKRKAEDALDQADELLGQIEDDPASVEQALRAAKIELKNEQGEEDYSAGRMKKFLRTARTNADRTLRRSVPERAEFLKEAKAAADKAVELMPELKDAKSDRMKMFRQILKEAPDLQKSPRWPLLALQGVLGAERLQEILDKKSKPAAPAVKPKRELPTVIPAPRAQAPAAPKPKAAAVDIKAAADRILSGDRSTRLELIKGFVPRTT